MEFDRKREFLCRVERTKVTIYTKSILHCRSYTKATVEQVGKRILARLRSKPLGNKPTPECPEFVQPGRGDLGRQTSAAQFRIELQALNFVGQ